MNPFPAARVQRPMHDHAPAAAHALVPRGNGVVVVYQPSPDGRAALAHARELASAAGAPLTVLAVMPHEREDVGCARCRQTARIWNHELGEIAVEQLEDAASLVGPSPDVEYEVARGPRPNAIADAASRCGAEVIVLPSQRSGRVRGRFSRDLAEQVRRAGRSRVVVAPAASAAITSG